MARGFSFRSTRQSAFNLVEMLVGVFLSLLLLGSILSWMTSYERSRGLIDAQLRLQDRWRGVYGLVAADLQESLPLAATTSLPCMSGKTVLALQLATADLSDAVYRYYLTNSSPAELWRCGPLSLDAAFGSTELAYLSANGSSALNVLVVKGVESISLDFADPQRPVFRLTLIDEAGVSYSNSSALSSIAIRSRVIGD